MCAPRFIESQCVTLTSCNPTRDSSTLSHIPKVNARIAFRIRLFSSFGFFQEVQSIQALLLSCHSLILIRSQIFHELHEKNDHTAPRQAPGVPSEQPPELFLGLNKVKLPEFKNATPRVSEINSRSLKNLESSVHCVFLQ